MFLFNNIWTHAINSSAYINEYLIFIIDIHCLNYWLCACHTLQVNPCQIAIFLLTCLLTYVVTFIVSADNQHAALYGGRMTASRLFHVGQVTSEAVEQLHRWVSRSGHVMQSCGSHRRIIDRICVNCQLMLYCFL